MSTARDRRYARLGVLEVALFVRDVLQQALELPLPLLIETIVIVLLYLPLLPLEAFALGARPGSAARLSWLQAGVVRIVNLAFTFFDPRLGRIVFGSRCSLPLMVRRFGGLRQFQAMCEHVDEIVDDQRISGWWIGPRNAEDALTILYLHGGGFAMGDPSFYLRFLDALRQECPAGTRIFAAAYPLAPEATYHQMLDTVSATWAWLSRQPNVKPDLMAIAGDSAGGALALSLRMAIVRGLEDNKDCFAFKDLPQPQLSILLSPITNLDTPTYPDPECSYSRNAATDFVDTDSLRHMCSSAVGIKNQRDLAVRRFVRAKLHRPTPIPRRPLEMAMAIAKDPVLSPHAHLDVLERANGLTLVCWGEAEVMADDCAKLTSISHKWEALTAPSVHAWPMVLFNLGRNCDERATGCEAIGRWVRDHMPAAAFPLPN